MDRKDVEALAEHLVPPCKLVVKRPPRAKFPTGPKEGLFFVDGCLEIRAPGTYDASEPGFLSDKASDIKTIRRLKLTTD